MPLRLVLIEDHQALREGLELLLGREGCEVVGTAGTAGEGRGLVEGLQPRVGAGGTHPGRVRGGWVPMCGWWTSGWATSRASTLRASCSTPTPSGASCSTPARATLSCW